MGRCKRTSLIVVMAATLATICLFVAPKQAKAVWPPTTYYPSSYLASMQYMDSNDLDYWYLFSEGPQQYFPVQGSGRLNGGGTDWTYHTPIDQYPRLVNMKRDFNDDLLIDPEDLAEMCFQYVISPSYYSTISYTGFGYRVDHAEAPNNQSPAVYWRTYDITGYQVWEYWTYYPLNDYPFSHHEGDWEWYFVYCNTSGVPSYVGISEHGNTHIDAWSTFAYYNKIEGGSHIKLGADAGSQAVQ